MLTNQIDQFDVVIITKNSLKPCLRQCLDSIYREILIHKVIVVDNFSTDGTVELLRNYPNITIVQKKTNRGQARQIGIDMADCSIIFVDSDVILLPNWLNQMRKYMRDDRWGMIWGNALPYRKNEIDIIRSAARVSHQDYLSSNARQGNRGYTHDTIVKLEAIKGIKIPEDLQVYEDAFIKRHVEAKGFRYIIGKDALCIHVRKPEIFAFRSRQLDEGLRLEVSSAIKYQFRQPRILISIAVKQVVFGLFVLFNTGNVSASLYVVFNAVKAFSQVFWKSLRQVPRVSQ